jgi:ABC-type transporter Mla subunit MlaD
VANTTEPVSLLDLFNTFNLPTRERMSVIVDELGIATAGRGQDLNQVLLRANPTLQTARAAISILTRQGAQLQTLIDSSDRLVTTGAAGKADLQRFLDRAAALSSTTAAHGSALSQSIARLPAMLAATRPSLTQLDAVATQGTPLLQQLTAAAPSLNRVANDLGPFATAAKPALSKLSIALGRAVPAVRQSTPLVRTILSYARRSSASTALSARLFSNLQRRGFTESFLSVFYYTAASLARFDGTSHILPLFLLAPNNGACGQYATKPVTGCGAHYGQQPAYQPQRRAGARRGGVTGAAPQSASGGRAAPGTGTSAAPPSPAAAAPAAGPPASTPPAPAPTNVLQALSSFLLK